MRILVKIDDDISGVGNPAGAVTAVPVRHHESDTSIGEFCNAWSIHCLGWFHVWIRN